MNNENKKPSVVIFGRTNVGKSTLFNKLTSSSKALTSKIQYTTRDSNVGTVDWSGREFELIDTGGIIDEHSYKILDTKTKKLPKNTIEEKIQKQALELLKTADVILFVVDTRAGLLPQDEKMAEYIKRRGKKNVILVANKVDDIKYQGETAVFYKLGLGEPQAISATTGSGAGDLLDSILQKLKYVPEKKEEKEMDNIPVCIIGKPNVGKSSLVNSFLGKEKIIVSDIPHTTREPQDIEIIHNEQAITLVDTAGINRKNKRLGNLEKSGIDRSLASLKRSEIALLVIDISKNITHQDAKLIEEILDRDKSLIIIANKWDLVEERDFKEFTEYIYNQFPFVEWAPIQFVSAKTHEKIEKILNLILEAHQGRRVELSDSQLNKFLKRIVKIHPPAKAKGVKPPHIHHIKQTGVNPPSFTVKIRKNDTLHFSYVNFIKNQLRKDFGFFASPIKIYVDKSKP